MVLGESPPYYLRLRVYARQVNYHYRRMRDKPPVYDTCPVRCLAPEADRVNGCPNCEYSLSKKTLKDNYHKLVEKRIVENLIELGVDPGKAKDAARENASAVWTFEDIEADYQTLSELEQYAGVETPDAPGKHDPGWTVKTAIGIGIVREERYLVRREFKYRADKEDEAKRRAAGLK